MTSGLDFEYRTCTLVVWFGFARLNAHLSQPPFPDGLNLYAYYDDARWANNGCERSESIKRSILFNYTLPPWIDIADRQKIINSMQIILGLNQKYEKGYVILYCNKATISKQAYSGSYDSPAL